MTEAVETAGAGSRRHPTCPRIRERGTDRSAGPGELARHLYAPERPLVRHKYRTMARRRLAASPPAAPIRDMYRVDQLYASSLVLHQKR